MMNFFKRLLFMIILLNGVALFVQAQDAEFHIVPEQTDKTQVQQDVEAVGDVHIDTKDKYNSVWDKYKEISKRDRELWDELASGIMNWDTLLNYVVYLVRFLSQLGLLIWAIMIVYAWYMYATTVFSGGNASKGKSAIQYAIIGIVVIGFSYAIIRLLTSMFIE